MKLHASTYRWAVIVVAGAGCAAIAGFASRSIFFAVAVFAVVVSAGFFVESS